MNYSKLRCLQKTTKAKGYKRSGKIYRKLEKSGYNDYKDLVIKVIQVKLERLKSQIPGKV